MVPDDCATVCHMLIIHKIFNSTDKLLECRCVPYVTEEDIFFGKRTSLLIRSFEDCLELAGFSVVLHLHRTLILSAP